MSILKLIGILSTLILFSACTKNYKLTKEDYNWLPYSGTETLVFGSNAGEIDSIFLLKRDTLLAYPEAQAMNGTKYEVATIFCKHSDNNSKNGEHRYLENAFVDLEKSKDGITRLYFRLLAKEANFYRITGIKTDSLGNEKFITLQTKYKTYHDIYIIEDEDWLDFKKRNDYVTKLYWSKSDGLVRYDKQNNVYWELTDKYFR